MEHVDHNHGVSLLFLPVLLSLMLMLAIVVIGCLLVDGINGKQIDKQKEEESAEAKKQEETGRGTKNRKAKNTFQKQQSRQAAELGKRTRLQTSKKKHTPPKHPLRALIPLKISEEYQKVYQLSAEPFGHPNSWTQNPAGDAEASPAWVTAVNDGNGWSVIVLALHGS